MKNDILVGSALFYDKEKNEVAVNKYNNGIKFNLYKDNKIRPEIEVDTDKGILYGHLETHGEGNFIDLIVLMKAIFNTLSVTTTIEFTHINTSSLICGTLVAGNAVFNRLDSSLLDIEKMTLFDLHVLNHIKTDNMFSDTLYVENLNVDSLVESEFVADYFSNNATLLLLNHVESVNNSKNSIVLGTSTASPPERFLSFKLNNQSVFEIHQEGLISKPINTFISAQNNEGSSYQYEPLRLNTKKKLRFPTMLKHIGPDDWVNHDTFVSKNGGIYLVSIYLSFGEDNYSSNGNLKITGDNYAGLWGVDTVDITVEDNSGTVESRLCSVQFPYDLGTGQEVSFTDHPNIFLATNRFAGSAIIYMAKNTEAYIYIGGFSKWGADQGFKFWFNPHDPIGNILTIAKIR